MTLLQGKGIRSIYMWSGDYEGYREVAQTRNIHAVAVDYAADPGSLTPGYWFLSNPSARNGMIVPGEKIQAIAGAGHKIFYDLSYLGATLPHRYDVSHPNVDAVAISFSKPYGLFYYRIGFLFSRESMSTLYANKWFKNIFSLLIADAVLQKLDMPGLARKYLAIQESIVGEINQELGLGISASDAFLLATLPASAGAALPKEKRDLLSRFRRDDWYRFCLTPYFLDCEKR
jgi:histidinol-phosphate/aromatic aminotransferase/cobyric acid decarboxylase-like protein